MKSSICKIGFLPDIHMGKPRINPEGVRQRLTDLFYTKIEDLDLIVFGGDFFNSSLTMNSDAGLCAATIIEEVLSLAYAHKVFVRVVTGTFFHDRYQNRFFEIKDKTCGKIDGVPLVKVFDTIELEYITPLNLSVIYCPDNQSDPTDKILDLLKVHRLDKIDFLFSHGYYEQLLPRALPQLPPNLINYSRINSFVQGFIMNGHIHTPSVHEKLISGGSFERLNHGEEHDKGFFIVSYDTKTKEASHEFIVNKFTTPFITLSLSDHPDMDSYIKAIDLKIAEIVLSHGVDVTIYLRLDGLATHDNFVVKYIEEKYNNVIVSIKSSNVYDAGYTLDETINTLPIITEDNLAQLIYDNVKDKNITLKEIEEFL